MDAKTQVLIVNTSNIIYYDAMLCCQENCGQLIKIDTSNKMSMLSDYLTGWFLKSNYEFETLCIQIN